jgi:hypothetical protein
MTNNQIQITKQNGKRAGFLFVWLLVIDHWILFVSCFLVIGHFIFSSGAAFAEGWKELGGDHFIVYYTGEDKFAKEVSDEAEDYYREIAIGIGYPRYSEFWTWAKRVKIYVYSDRESYLKASDMPEWSHGMADYDKKEIMSYLWSEMFTESILPHEIAHLIFRDFVGFKGTIPLWLDEGVAQWAEKKKRKALKEMAGDLYDKDRLLTVNDMMYLDIMRFKDAATVHFRPTFTKEGKAATVILDTDALISTYYIVSVSIIDFLIDGYGSDRFAEFCRQLRDGKVVEEALRVAYPAKILDLSDLETRWRAYLAEE